MFVPPLFFTRMHVRPYPRLFLLFLLVTHALKLSTKSCVNVLHRPKNKNLLPISYCLLCNRGIVLREIYTRYNYQLANYYRPSDYHLVVCKYFTTPIHHGLLTESTVLHCRKSVYTIRQTLCIDPVTSIIC